MRLGAQVPFVESLLEFKAIFEFCVYKMHIGCKVNKRERGYHVFILMSFQSLFFMAKTKMKVFLIKPKRCLSLY